MRREAARGAFVTVAKKGAQQAGALFIVQNHLDGTYDVFGPAPQSILEEDASDRKFERVLAHADQPAIDQYFEKQKRFDPDLWIIETESGSGTISLDLMP